MKKRVAYSLQATAFIASLPIEAQFRLDLIVSMLETEGRLVAPYGEKVEGQKGLFEIRVKDSSGQYRVFYVYADKDVIYLLNGFMKKTQKTPLAEIRKALKIKKELGL